MSKPEKPQDLPGDLAVLDAVCYHLPSNFTDPDGSSRKGDARFAIVTDLYIGEDKKAHASLTVIPKDGHDSASLLFVPDARFDTDCHPGTFCTLENAKDDTITVSELMSGKQTGSKKESGDKGGEGSVDNKATDKGRDSQSGSTSRESTEQHATATRTPDRI